MIYLDNSATTRPCAAAVHDAHEAMENAWHNPSALYHEAIAVQKKMESARHCLADFVGAEAEGLVFTGSGTEADSLAILGSAAHFRPGSRVLLFMAEHPAVLNTANQLIALGHSVEWIPATQDGVIDLGALPHLMNDQVALVSCMHVNNETGALQPVKALVDLVKGANAKALVHVDGVQGFLRLPMHMRQTGVDLYCVSAHKIHGLKGTGAMIRGKGVKIDARITGGGQEGGLRSGTENTAGIAAFASAARWASSQENAVEVMRAIKLRLFRRLSEAIDGLRVNGPDPEGDSAAPHILNISFPGVGGEVMLHALEAEGVLVGTGAACSSKKKTASPAFAAMRAPGWAAENAVRFSIGWMNTQQDAELAAQAAIRCYQKYRVRQRR